jgi:hypothetical protein
VLSIVRVLSCSTCMYEGGGESGAGEEEQDGAGQDKEEDPTG